MNALEIAIKNAIRSEGGRSEANKAYLEFLKANFLIPIEMKTQDGEPVVLYLHENNTTFLPVFTNRTFLDGWAADIQDHIQVLILSGVDLLKGLGDNVTISLNPGSNAYKEFNPSELARLKSMVLKLWR